eukprot:m51a1_g4813 hypothetical protein (396) ;mRNA; r:138013-139561
MAAAAAQTAAPAAAPAEAPKAADDGKKETVRYLDGVTNKWLVLPRHRNPRQRILRRNDWYCRICDNWVEDDTPHIVCSNDKCEDIFHLQCVKLAQLPTGDWFCPDKCRGTPRDAPESETSEGAELNADGKTWKAMKPLVWRGTAYPRVWCETLKRTYYPMNPLAYDLLNLPGASVSSQMLKHAEEPERLRITSKSHPRDADRLRRLGVLSPKAPRVAGLESPGGAQSPRGGQIRVLVTLEAVRSLIDKIPALQSDANVTANMAMLDEVLRNDDLSPQPDPVADEPTPTADGAAGANKRSATDMESQSTPQQQQEGDPGLAILVEVRAIAAELARARAELETAKADIALLKSKALAGQQPADQPEQPEQPQPHDGQPQQPKAQQAAHQESSVSALL